MVDTYYNVFALTHDAFLRTNVFQEAFDFHFFRLFIIANIQATFSAKLDNEKIYFGFYFSKLERWYD